MKRTVVAVLFGLTVLTGCQGAPAPVDEVVPQAVSTEDTDPMVKKLTVEEIAAAAQLAADEAKAKAAAAEAKAAVAEQKAAEAKVTAERAETTATGTSTKVDQLAATPAPTKVAEVPADCPEVNLVHGQTVAEPATYSTPKRNVWTCSNGKATSKQEDNPAYDPDRVAKDAATSKGPLAQ